MAFSDLNVEIGEAREAHLELRGYLRGDEEFSPLDGAYRSLKSPQLLLVGDQTASVDQQCESLEHMVTSLHRVADLLATLHRRCTRRTLVGSLDVISALQELEESPSFLYFDHFTNAAKHTTYVPRGCLDGVVFIEAFDYRDRNETGREPRRTAAEIIEYAREVIRISTVVMASMSRALDGARTFDYSSAQVCATPVTDPALYSIRTDKHEE
jgi:hypothetical protein